MAKTKTHRVGKTPRKNLVLTPEVASSMFRTFMSACGPVLERFSRIVETVDVLAKTNAELVEMHRELIALAMRKP